MNLDVAITFVKNVRCKIFQKVRDAMLVGHLRMVYSILRKIWCKNLNKGSNDTKKKKKKRGKKRRKNSNQSNDFVKLFIIQISLIKYL